jgi:NAD(P)-dependent dehydrogenase (short-subunit alcohol dehydrogenase family)
LNKSEKLREIASLEKIPLHVAQLDVNDDASVENAIDSIIKEDGRIDLLVNNAGYDLFGPLEEASIDEIRKQFETNFFGVVRVTKAAIPPMRKQRSGTIINISSVGGRIGLTPFGTAYHASKFAVEGLTESLRHELVEFNINVILIEPGLVMSNFMENIKTVAGFDPNNSPYAKHVQQLFQGLESFVTSSSQPIDVAQVILKAVNSSSPELRYPVGKDANFLFKTRAELSDRDMEKWVRESYMEKKGFVRQ